MMPPSTDHPFADDNDPKVQAWRLKRVEKLVETIAEDVAEMKLAAAKLPPPCPRPGLCIEHEKEIGELKTLVEQGRGAWKLASVAGAILGGLGSFVGFKLFWK